MSHRAQELIATLLADPQAFGDSGASYALLQEYFKGLPLETLSPLLRHSDDFVRRAALWIASELGVQAAPLLLDVLPMLDTGDRFLAYHALEVTAVCATAASFEHFYRVLRELESPDDVLRILAMRLVGNTGADGMRALLKSVSTEKWDRRHVDYLRHILTAGQANPGKVVEEMLRSPALLERKYGAILAHWALPDEPHLVLAATRCDDEDVRRYAEGIVRIHQ